MSDTPRTDECLAVNAHRTMGNAERQSLIDFARALERELAEAKAGSVKQATHDMACRTIEKLAADKAALREALTEIAKEDRAVGSLGLAQIAYSQVCAVARHALCETEQISQSVCTCGSEWPRDRHLSGCPRGESSEESPR